MIYVIGIYAIVLGAYAVVGLGALIAGLFTHASSLSVDDLVGVAALGALIAITLGFSAVSLYGIWIAARRFVTALRR